MLGKDIRKKTVYTIDDGRELGVIKDLYLDPEARRVVALFVGREGLLRRKPRVIRLQDIQVMGVDIWLAHRGTAVLDLAELPDADRLLRLDDLCGRKLETAGQTPIGSVEDVEMDERGRVTALALGKVSIQGPVAERKAVPRDAVSSLGAEGEAVTVDLELAEQAD